MFGIYHQSEGLGRRRPALALAASLALILGGVSLLAVPVVRATEAGETSGSHERNEDPSLTTRFEHDRLLSLESRVASFLQLVRPCLGHAQRPVLDLLPGHRLANGLLAPMTC
jgi:hypothetical protein